MEKLRNIGRKAVLLGTILGFGASQGCAEMIGPGIRILADNSKYADQSEINAAHHLANVVDDKIAHERNMEVANQIGSEVNVYNQPQNTNNLIRYTMSFNKFIDRNGNTLVDEEDKFFGVKDIFKQGEQIELMLMHQTNENVRGKELNMTLFRDGKNAGTLKVINPFDNLFGAYLPAKGQFDVGDYEMQYSTQGNVLATHKFKVIQ